MMCPNLLLMLALFWEPSFHRKYATFVKKCFQMEPKLEPKSALGGNSFPYFHPWVVKVAQVVPDGTQRLPRVPKDYQNGAKMLSKVMKTWPCRHLNDCDSPNGGPFSKLYQNVTLYIYTHIMLGHGPQAILLAKSEKQPF